MSAFSNGELPVLEIKGSARERGRQQGEALGPQIQALVGAWQGLIAATGVKARDFVADFLEHTRFAQAIEEWTPGLLDEVRGIAEAAEIDFETLLAFNCTDENQWFQRHRGMGLELPGPRGCSSLGVWGGAGPPLVAQTMDIPSGTDGFQFLLRVRQDQQPTEVLLLNLVGMVGIAGLSNGPVGLCNNGLSQLQTRTDGLPVNFVVRGALSCPDYLSAVEFLRRVPHASGQNYVVGGAEEVAMLECSAAGAATVSPLAPGRLIHSNHPVASRDFHGHEALTESTSDSDTHQRWTALERRITDVGTSAFGMDEILDALRSHDDPQNPVCRHLQENPAQNFTAATMVCELSAPPVLHLAPGPLCSTRLLQHPLS
jgi:hypothetical protein